MAVDAVKDVAGTYWFGTMPIYGASQQVQLTGSGSKCNGGGNSVYVQSAGTYDVIVIPFKTQNMSASGNTITVTLKYGGASVQLFKGGINDLGNIKVLKRTVTMSAPGSIAVTMTNTASTYQETRFAMGVCRTK